MEPVERENKTIPTSPVNAPEEEMPLIFIDVSISPTETKRISIFAGDTPEELSEDFCRIHKLGDKMRRKLELLLQGQLDELTKEYLDKK